MCFVYIGNTIEVNAAPNKTELSTQILPETTPKTDERIDSDNAPEAIP